MQLQPVVGQLGNGQELDAVAKFLGILQVGHIERIDSVPRDLAPMDPRTKRQMGQDRQFLGGIRPVHVHRWVSLGVAEFLRFGDRRCVTRPVLLHLRDNEVARAVKDPA